eukprot:scaffold24716_cov64-Attheya_sp.AAC.1
MQIFAVCSVSDKNLMETCGNASNLMIGGSLRQTLVTGRIFDFGGGGSILGDGSILSFILRRCKGTKTRLPLSLWSFVIGCPMRWLVDDGIQWCDEIIAQVGLIFNMKEILNYAPSEKARKREADAVFTWPRRDNQVNHSRSFERREVGTNGGGGNHQVNHSRSFERREVGTNGDQVNHSRSFERHEFVNYSRTNERREVGTNGGGGNHQVNYSRTNERREVGTNGGGGGNHQVNHSRSFDRHEVGTNGGGGNHQVNHSRSFDRHEVGTNGGGGNHQ